MTQLTVFCPSCAKPATFSELVPFRAECDSCAADLHVCVACRFYDRFVEKQCREDAADPVAVKERRNLCEYFKPKGEGAVDDEAAKAKARLAALFGPSSSSSSAPSAPASSSASDDAKKKLEELFKKK